MQKTKQSIGKVSRVCQKILDDLDAFPFTTSTWSWAPSGNYFNRSLSFEIIPISGIYYVRDLDFSPKETRIISDKILEQINAKQRKERKARKLELISKILPDQNSEELLAEMELP